MNKRIKELAVQAIQETAKQGVHDGLAMSLDALERFADLVRQNEREACAKLCESMGVHPALNVWGGGPEWYQRQKECAAAIRARSEK